MADETVRQGKTQAEQKLPVEMAEDVNPESVIDKLPPEIKKVMEVGFSMQRFSCPVPSPFLTKINDIEIVRHFFRRAGKWIWIEGVSG